MEALERRHIAGVLFVAIWAIYGVSGQPNKSNMSYVCPAEFIRLGHSCYYFSKNASSWHNALYDCQDRDSNLTVPARWEDRNLRQFLNKPTVEKATRWIGGLYDDVSQSWRWGGELRQMHYQSFSKMKKMTPLELKFHCISMMPERLYRWAPLPCYEPHQYICQRKLQKVTTFRKKELKRRWEPMGVMNEIIAPSLSRETNDTMMNDVTVSPKSFDLYSRQKQRPQKRGHNRKSQRPNEMRKRSRPNARSKLTRPFPGYTWNRRDPEGSYQRNVELLRSGRTGLSAQKIKTHLARLRHLRDKQIARRKRLREREDWLVNEPKRELTQTHARTYTLDNNISALHPKTIVEEFDMFPPPQPVAVRSARRAAYSVV